MLISIGKREPKREDDPLALLEACHVRIRKFSALALAAGSRDDVSDDERRDACEKVERYFSIALPLHVRDEEDSVLPRLQGTDPEVDRALEVMEAQHEGHEARLAALLAAARAVREDPADRGRRGALAAAAQILVDEFETHLKLEEAILFPAIARLPPEVKVEVFAEARSRRQV
ncbi:MAG TPA: hemerythrin domain-containing protein [Vulgatibacter sp.]